MPLEKTERDVKSLLQSLLMLASFPYFIHLQSSFTMKTAFETGTS